MNLLLTSVFPEELYTPDIKLNKTKPYHCRSHHRLTLGEIEAQRMSTYSLKKKKNDCKSYQ